MSSDLKVLITELEAKITDEKARFEVMITKLEAKKTDEKAKHEALEASILKLEQDRTEIEARILKIEQDQDRAEIEARILKLEQDQAEREAKKNRKFQTRYMKVIIATLA
ncbi:unnamed protein product [Rhizophagus irregularis]|nr:unnamed protein product [Rhizophagus irregularis]